MVLGWLKNKSMAKQRANVERDLSALIELAEDAENEIQRTGRRYRAALPRASLRLRSPYFGLLPGLYRLLTYERNTFDPSWRTKTSPKVLTSPSATSSKQRRGAARLAPAVAS